jgi:hypothetical protein
MPDETPKTELQEVVLVEKPQQLAQPEQNPAFGLISEGKFQEMTQGVNVQALAGGIAGAFAVGMIPQLVKWNTGWKNIAVSLGTTLIGGLLIGKVNKAAAYGFVLGGGTVTAIKVLRMFLGDRPELKVLGNGLGASDLIYDVGADEYEEFFGSGADVLTEEELFGIGEDPIIPTAGDY